MLWRCYDREKNGSTSVNHQTYTQEILYEEPENLASKSMVTPACNHPPKATSEKSTRRSQEQEHRGIIAGRGRPALLIIALILTTVVIASASAAITVLLFQRSRPSTPGRILIMNWLELIFILPLLENFHTLTKKNVLPRVIWPCMINDMCLMHMYTLRHLHSGLCSPFGVKSCRSSPTIIDISHIRSI